MAVADRVVLEPARLSLDWYHRAIEAGVFEDDERRLEFINGVITEMSPRGEGHDDTIVWLADRLYDAVDRDRYGIRVQCAITLESTGSEPEPDLFVHPRDAPRAYHPSSAALVIEVTRTSKRRDLVEKPPIYAAAGIPDYWVVDLDKRRVVVHREPGPEGYGRVEDVTSGELTAVGVSIDVAALLAVSGA